MTVGAVAKKQSNFSKILTGIWDEFVYGGHLLSLGASAIVLTVTIMIHRDISIPLILISYLVTQVIYTLNHYREIQLDIVTNPERARHLIASKNVLPFLISFYVISIITLLVLFSNYITIIFTLVLGFLGFFYLKNLTKTIIGFKNYYVAFLWAAASVLLPYLFFSITFDKLFYFIFIFIFVRWLINTTFFDLKDVDGDRLEGLKTIPVVIGVNKTLYLLAFYNIISAFILLFLVYSRMIELSFISYLFFIIYTIAYLLLAVNADKEKIRKISYIMVDGEYILWPIIMLVGRLIAK